MSQILLPSKIYLIEISFEKEVKLAFYSSWILDRADEKYPDLLSQKQLNLIIKKIVESTNYSVIRSLVRLLSRGKDIILQGTLVDQCFKWLSLSQTPVAIKAHCMEILFNASIKIPDLRNELRQTIEMQLPHASAGFVSRGNKIIQQLNNNSTKNFIP